MFDPDVKNVSTFLKNKNILINPTNKWLQDCVSCFKSNTPSFSLELLKNFVFEQWLLADLSDISSPTLPQECKNVPEFLLPDKYAVQINYAVNVGEAFHRQLQKIRRPEAEANLSIDVEKEKNQTIPANRMYKFEITDGVIVMKGFEDKVISVLPETIVPGVKAILCGPIECRKGILFLKSTNIQLLGGEVDTLLIPNCTENILARTLGLPENPTPYKLSLDTPGNEYSDLMDEDKDLLLQVAEEMDYPIGRENGMAENISYSSNLPPNFTNVNGSCVLNNMSSDSSVICLDDDDDTFAITAVETTAAAEKMFCDRKITKDSYNNTSTVKKTKEKKKLVTKESRNEKSETQSSIDSFVCRNVPTNEKDSVKSCKSLNKTSSKDLRNALQESYSHFSSHGNSLKGSVESGTFPPPHKFNLEIPPSHSEEGKIIVDITKEFSLDSVQLSQSEERKSINIKSHSNVVKDVFPPKNFPCTKIVMGKVVKLSQKLGLSNGKWSLSVILSVRGVELEADISSELEVDISSETLDKLFGITAAQLQGQRNEVKKNPAMKSEINEILKSSQQRIRQLHSKMKIHFSNYISKPVIIDIIE